MPEDFEIRELNQSEYLEWDTLVAASAQGTIFHTTPWLSGQKTYDFKIMVCCYKKNIIGGIPLPYTRRFGLKIAVNPPFTPYLGIVFRASYQKYSKKLALEKKVSYCLGKEIKNFAPYLRYSFHYNYVDAQPLIWNGYSLAVNYTYVIDLTKPLETILENMVKETRNRITKASREPITFHKATYEEILRLILLTYKRKNQRLPYSKQVLAQYVNMLFNTKSFKSIIARDPSGTAIAGGLIVYDSQRAYYLVGCISPKSESTGIGSLIIWKLIEYSQSIGLREFDFEGSMNENIERFFRGFGGKLLPKTVVFKNNLFASIVNTALRIR